MDTAEFARFMASAQQTVDSFNALARKTASTKRPRPLELAANIEEIGAQRWAYLVFTDGGLLGRRTALSRMDEPPQIEPETLAEMKDGAPKTRRELWTAPHDKWVNARREDLASWDGLDLRQWAAVDGQLFVWECEARAE